MLLLNTKSIISKKFFFLTLLLQLLIFSLLIFLPLKASLALIIGIGAIFFVLTNPNPMFATLVLSILVAVILPRPTGRTLVFKIEEVFPLLMLLFSLFTWIQSGDSHISTGSIGRMLGGFFVVVFVSAIIGLLKEHGKIYIFDEMMTVLAWGMYFLVIKNKISEKEIKYIFGVLILSVLIISFYYLYEFWRLDGKDRFRTDQQHLFNITIPLLFSVLLYDTQKIRKILAILLMIPMVIAVYITLTRALWLLVPLAIFLQYVYFIRDSFKIQKVKSFLLPIIIIVVVGISGIMLLQGIFGVSNLFGWRFATFQVLEYDISLLARAELAQYVFEKVSSAPLFGSGLGDFLRYQYFATLGRFNVYWLDNTYLQVLWKTGIIGLVLFLGFLTLFLKRAWFVLKNATTAFDKIIGSGIFFSFFALMISSLQCGILIGYRFNFVWGILMGITELKARELELLKHTLPNSSPQRGAEGRG